MTSATVTIHAGAVISYFGRTFCVRKLISPEEVLATDVAAGEDQLLKLSDITRSFGEVADQEAERLDLVSIPEDDWQDAWSVTGPLHRCWACHRELPLMSKL